MRTCRCGAIFGPNTLDLVNHVASEDHAARLAALGLKAPTDLYRCQFRAGLKVQCTRPTGHPGAHHLESAA